MNQRSRGRVGRAGGRSPLLRIGVAIVLTALVLYNAHPAAVFAVVADAHLGWISVALGLVLADRSLMALRWIDLLSALTPGSRPSFPVVLRIFFVSSFVSNFVPSVAADAYRAYALARHDVRLAESAASVLMDRVLGVLSIVIVGALALLASNAAVPVQAVAIVLALAFAACAIGGAILFSERTAALVPRAAALVPWSPLRRAATSLTDAVRRYATHHAVLVRVLVMSALVQAARILQAWCLGRALGIELPLAIYGVLIPVIVLIMQVPITVNGFGTTQVAFDRLFVPAGADPAATFALSILFLALGILGSLPGGLLYASAWGQPGVRRGSDGGQTPVGPSSDPGLTP